MLETFILFAVLLCVIEAFIRLRRINRILRCVDALNELGRKRLP
jgi:hypothetical protein